MKKGKRPKTPIEVMSYKNRAYLTPEDITASIKSGCPKETVQHEVLVMLGKKACEDWSLCAFLAWNKFEPKWNTFEPKEKKT